MSSKFSLINEDNGARLGQIITPRGIIDTPAFMPVGTAATVKALTVDQINQTNSQIILCNTYHLYLRPGTERIERVGGLHNFMNFKKPISSKKFKDSFLRSSNIPPCTIPKSILLGLLPKAVFDLFAHRVDKSIDSLILFLSLVYSGHSSKTITISELSFF